MSSTEHGTVFEASAAASSAVRSLPRIAGASGPRMLSPTALKVAAQRFKPAYSPIVLAGTVRLLEAALIIAIGLAVYFWHVVPAVGFAWYYVGTIVGIAVMAMLAFQIADIYQVQAFRGHEKQYMRLAAAWSVVFLIAISVSFFAKAGDQFSRAWLGAFYALGLLALIAFRRGLFLLVRRWTRQGRLDRRTIVVGADGSGEALLKALAAQRDSDVRVIGVFDDRGDDRSLPTCAGVPKLGTVDDVLEFARKTRVDLVIFALQIGRAHV